MNYSNCDGRVYNNMNVYLVVRIIILHFMSAPTLTLSLPVVTYLCPGGLLNLTCSTNETALRWNVTDPLDQNSDTRSFTVFDSFEQVRSIRIRSSTLNVTRTHPGDSSTRLVSVMTSENVSSDINGIIIRCGGRFKTNVHINAAEDVPDTPRVLILEEQFKTDHVKLVLEWTPSTNRPTTYSVNVVPQVHVNLTERTSVQLNVPYNTQHNVSVIATLCREENRRSNNFEINYAKCGNPLCKAGDAFLRVSGYNDPALEGANLTLSCSSELVLIGPTSLTCTSDGEWEPECQAIECKANCSIPTVNGSISYNSTLEGSIMTVSCDDIFPPGNEWISICRSDGNWEPEPLENGCIQITEGGHKNVISITVIIGSSLGSLTVMVLILSLSVLIIIVITMRRKGSILRSREKHVNVEQSELQCLDRSEYSSLQHYPFQEDNRRQSETNTKVIKNEAPTLVYADIGPISLKKKPLCVPTFNQDDYSVEYAQITVNADTSHLTKETLSVINHPNDIDDCLNLDSMLIQLRPEVTEMWYQFGDAIGVEKQLLDKYNVSQHTSDDCFIEVLDNWLRNHLGPPTWNEVAEALEKIGLRQLAHDIRNSYTTGKLPTDIDTNSDIIICPVPELDSELLPPIPPRDND